MAFNSPPSTKVEALCIVTFFEGKNLKQKRIDGASGLAEENGVGECHHVSISVLICPKMSLSPLHDNIIYPVTVPSDARSYSE
jgi:hypothetical protein